MSTSFPSVNIQTFRPASINEFLQVVNGAKAAISSNLHPLILASMLHVPGVAIATNTKTLDFMEESGQGRRALSQLQLERDWHLLSDRISDALKLSDEGLSALDSRAAHAKMNALKPFRELAAFLNYQ